MKQKAVQGTKRKGLEVSTLISEVNQSNSSRSHVLADLQPYLCTIEGCESMLLTFSNRSAWSEHEFRCHRNSQTQRCLLCSTPFVDVDSFLDHLKRDHNATTARSAEIGPQLLGQVDEIISVKDEQCPFCKASRWTSKSRFSAHLGRHLEEIALSALPTETEDELEQGTETPSELHDFFPPIVNQGPAIPNLDADKFMALWNYQLR